MTDKTKKGLVISFHPEKVDFIFNELSERMKCKQFPFNLKKAKLPEKEHIPPASIMPRGSRAHRLFLFHACNYMRKSDSNVSFLALWRVYKRHPEIFFPENFRCKKGNVGEKKKREWVGNILATQTPLKAGLTDARRFWVLNSIKLDKFYEGDPKNIFTGQNNFWEIRKIIQNGGPHMKKNPQHGFMGFQIKMVSMLTYFYCASDIIPMMVFPPPFDIHVSRLLFINEVFTFSNLSDAEDENGKLLVNCKIDEKEKEIMGRYLSEYITKKNINPVDFAAALWVYDRIMCSSSPVNRVTKLGGKGRNTEFAFTTPVKWNAREINLFKGTCMKCPFLKLCNFRIPGSVYGAVGGSFCLKEMKDKEDIGRHFHMEGIFD